MHELAFYILSKYQVALTTFIQAIRKFCPRFFYFIEVFKIERNDARPDLNQFRDALSVSLFVIDWKGRSGQKPEIVIFAYLLNAKKTWN